ncbi:hypothetical protein AAFM46_10870 [Arthrobacter sp. TMP15]|uniref:hypothetical protein n=1 Tax=Arthrobacter sp. TMP15 TaxID=3140789 RepID=UPI0031BB7778
MSDSPKPSAPAGKSAELPTFPSRMFFDALDYPQGRDRTNVEIARGKSVAQLHRDKDRLAVAISHLRAADEVGKVQASFEVLVAWADAFQKSVHALARLARNAETRFDDANPVVEDPAPDTAAVTPDEALAAELQRLAHGPLVVSTVNVGPDGTRHHPRTMAEAMQIRNAKLSEIADGRA